MNDAKRKFPHPGRVEWISVRPASGEPVQEVQHVIADVEQGLIGDRFNGGPGAPRQVSLIQKENLEIVAKLLNRDSLDPALARRNILVSGINLVALKKKTIQIGQAKLVITAGCPPCGRMEMNFGEGAYNAMIGHGGVTAMVLEGGSIAVGDTVNPIWEDAVETEPV